MTTVIERTPSDVVDKAVNEIIMEEENNGFKRGELKPYMEKVSEKYDVPFTTIRNRYYRDVKDKVKPNRKAISVKKGINTKDKKEKDLVVVQPAVSISTLNEIKNETPRINTVDEDIRKFNEKPVDRIFTSAKDHYKLTQFVDVKISNIQSYGAFCEILDGRGFQALCHISEIVDGFIKDVNDYFEVGQIIHRAKICLVDTKKVNVTTKHLHLKKRELPVITADNKLEVPANPAVNNIGEKFGNLKEKLLQRVTENTNSNVLKNDQKEIDEIFALEELSQSQEEMIKKYDKDIFQMTTYLQEELGVLSKPAKLELANIIEQQGLFNTIRAMMKTQENFKADIGLLFMQQMKNKMGEYL